MVCVPALRAPAPRPQPLAEERTSYKFDRRRSGRHPVARSMPATFATGDGGFGMSGVEVIDASSTGMCVRSALPVRPGMTLSFHQPGCYFPVLTGTVVRCTRDTDGYRLGLALAGGPKRAA